MKVIKEGGNAYFDTDPETTATVSQMLVDPERNGTVWMP